ncbi:MAG TPA: 2'-5' RNA ligase family protein [Nocardioidaceae bacterium]|nr:2'-5' RNA ligase family protein [Nocardioidaceae bacterium]
MGHTVLAVPVPALESEVRERTAFYDPTFVSSDPRFVHAHITLLAPWVSRPTDADLATVAAIARGTRPFDVVLSEVAEFPDGVIHLVPEPQDPLRRLTARISAAFPETPPYQGVYDEVVPHLTLDRRSQEVTPAVVHRRVAHLLPAAVPVTRIDLQWWANDDCRVLHTWRLGARP